MLHKKKKFSLWSKRIMQTYFPIFFSLFFCFLNNFFLKNAAGGNQIYSVTHQFKTKDLEKKIEANQSSQLRVTVIEWRKNQNGWRDHVCVDQLQSSREIIENIGNPPPPKKNITIIIFIYIFFVFNHFSFNLSVFWLEKKFKRNWTLESGRGRGREVWKNFKRKIVHFFFLT